MSWFAGSGNINIDEQIEKATDESIPFGETDLVTSLEITDLIRSKKVTSKDAMRSLKKRLISTKNPNTQLSSLHLIDTCVKNGGGHFILEISSREFLDSLISIIHEDKTNENVRNLTLELIQNWNYAFKDNFQFKYLTKIYKNLKDENYDFPTLKSNEISSTLFDSNAPPEWEDSDACMICSNAFTLINRKHHCRNCGGVFCQTHSSNFIQLLELGITEPVRVCDTCYQENNKKSQKNKKNHSTTISRSKHDREVSKARAQYESDDDDDNDEDLKKALELSLKESQNNAYYNEPPKPETTHAEISQDEDDEDIKAAIAASLRDMEQQTQQKQQQQEQQQQSSQQENGPYSNLLPRRSTNTGLPESNHSKSTELLSNILTPQEENVIREFALKVNDLQNNVPIDNTELNELYRNSLYLKPKLSQELNETFNKYEKFMELNDKINTIMKLYNSLLDERIERDSLQHQQFQHQHQQQQQQQQYTPHQQYVQNQTSPYPQEPQLQHLSSGLQQQPLPQSPYQQRPQQSSPSSSSAPQYQSPSYPPQQQINQEPSEPSYPVQYPPQQVPENYNLVSSPLYQNSTPVYPTQNKLQVPHFITNPDSFRDEESYQPEQSEVEVEEEEEFSAPPQQEDSYEPIPENIPQFPLEPPTEQQPQQHQQQQSQQSDNNQPIQPVYPGQQLRTQQDIPQYSHYPSQPHGAKITDLNFPSVPISKPPQVIGQQQQQSTRPEFKEETLIEL
ncbi:hypothetical protein WICMUC_001248 [Wickerhamomyces mucosus]|uniref:Vacuolar protein sorting-associated protein 27 n=1 Tax=Wickerhamomyces mucosus TaxID=1378264 RepID=A0A9P8TGT9_9ASCO|nr:hypothetical protein WICMUC_001248 [Wickerhamomyces mucosus]